MQDWSTFRREQDRIHAEFEVSMQCALAKGLDTDPLAASGRQAYTVVLQPEQEVREVFALLAEEVMRVVPGALIYPKHDEIHATLARCLYFPEGPARKIADLAAVNTLVETLLPRLPRLWCEHGGYIFGQTNLIAKGIPKPAYLDVAQELVEASRKAGLRLKLSWGLHSTIARFTKKTDPEVAQMLAHLIRELRFRIPVQTYTFSEIRVGWVFVDKKLGVEPHYRFPL